jgi:hypothetical protein
MNLYIVLSDHNFPADVEEVGSSSWADVSHFCDEKLSSSNLDFLLHFYKYNGNVL